MSPIPPTNSTTAATAASATGAVTSSSVDADKNMFLQLLVAQLQNQDPTNPTDSSTFVTQLAQFQQLESTVNMGQDVSQIRSDADQFLADYTAGTTTGTGSTSTNQTT
jgi:flagellar basal-body rod modification protein FlgD